MIAPGESQGTIMAEEARLGGLLGGEEGGEDPGAESPAAPLDPHAAAMAMHAASADPSLAARAAAYFETQSRLVAIQTEHLHEQREVALSHLKLKRTAERLRVAAQLFISLIATLVAAYILVMVHDAFTSRAVIVDPFDAPPALAGNGLSGRVIAGALLDELTRLQLATQSSAAKRGLQNSWSGDIRVELPETGLSLGDIDKFLKSRFGNDIHIGGDLVQTPTGLLELTVRGDGVTPKTFSGPVTDLHALTRQAGEYVYGQTQPALYAVYLAHTGRNEDAIAFSKAAILTAAPDERPYIYNAWAAGLGNTGAPVQESLALERAALALKPDYWTAYQNASLYARTLGDEEGAWNLIETMRAQAGGRPGAAPEIAYATWDYLTFNLLAARAALIADAESHAGIGSNMFGNTILIAPLDIDLHDAEDLHLRQQTFDMKDPYTVALVHYLNGRLAEQRGDTATAAREMEAYAAANANPAISNGDTSFNCYVAPAEEAAGHPDRADAALKAGGHFVDCARFHADILDRRGDWQAAQRAYADAVAMAPDLPAAYYSWGLALARHNDLPGAIEKLSAAADRGPHWADPLKTWGDILARQGNTEAAIEKYDAALQYAPAWPELKAARAAVKP
jgi:tetratricopeptide (TPR) repeat protein